MLQIVALLREALSKLVHQLCNQFVGPLGRVSRLIHEAGLNLPPMAAELAIDIVFEQRLQMALSARLLIGSHFLFSESLRLWIAFGRAGDHSSSIASASSRQERESNLIRVDLS